MECVNSLYPSNRFSSYFINRAPFEFVVQFVKFLLLKSKIQVMALFNLSHKRIKNKFLFLKFG